MSGKGVISENGLMQKLVQAKKVMNKVDGGNFERGHVNETILRSNPEEINVSEIGQTTPQRAVQHSSNKIMESKLPDAIKRAMIENPIPQSSKPRQTQTTKSVPTSNIDMNEIAIIIENTVRKVMDEKLSQILTAQQTLSINENLVLKVGDSIFKGKITGVNKSK